MVPTLGPKRSHATTVQLERLYIEANLVYDKDNAWRSNVWFFTYCEQFSFWKFLLSTNNGDIVDAKTYRVLDCAEQTMEAQCNTI